MREVIDFTAARIERERIIIAVAGLVEANPQSAHVFGVAEFAFEVRWHRNNRGVDFYADTLRHLRVEHAEALRWAEEKLSMLAEWRKAIFRRSDEWGRA
jgi:hypothetical protein